MFGVSRDQLAGRKTRDWLIGARQMWRSFVILKHEMRSILLIHKPHYRQRSRVCKAGTGITEDVSSEERTSELPGR